ncbi:hypothetical protein [Streptomyces sp. NPDC050704]|uniref:hypothetical protein n=1 Tax=Streptomyces sp. NPDC050704 TaxID=3157219 RepID=UPI003420206A
MRNATRTALAALFLGVLGAAGCTQSGGTTPDPVLPRPFDGALSYDQRERQVLHTADERLVADCMRRRGLSYEPQPLATGGTDPQDVNPYGLLTTTQARQDGYGITSARLAARPLADPNRDRARDPGWSRALLGTKSHEVRISLPGGTEFFYNSDACVTQARQALYGADYDRLSSKYQVLSNQVITAVRNDPRYQSAQRRWAQCMRAAGVTATSLDDPRSFVEQRLKRADSQSRQLHDVARYELKVAGQDADCQRTTGLPRTVAEAQAHAETTGAGVRTTDLRRLRGLRAAAIRRATAPPTAPAVREGSGREVTG